jgi:hypothetical protein
VQVCECCFEVCCGEYVERIREGKLTWFFVMGHRLLDMDSGAGDVAEGRFVFRRSSGIGELLEGVAEEWDLVLDEEVEVEATVGGGSGNLYWWRIQRR